MSKAYKLLSPAHKHPAETICYYCRKNDYGCASDDTRETDIHHVSMTLNADGDYPFFTVPLHHLALATQEEVAAALASEPPAPALTAEQIDQLKAAIKVGSTDEWVSIRRELRDALVGLTREADRSLDYRPEFRRAISNAHTVLSTPIAAQPAAAEAVEVTNELATFKARFSRFDLRPSVTRVGHFNDLRVEHMWDAWQSRASLAAPAQPAPEPAAAKCTICYGQTAYCPRCNPSLKQTKPAADAGEVEITVTADDSVLLRAYLSDCDVADGSEWAGALDRLFHALEDGSTND